MGEIKTKQNDANVHDFINSFADTEQKKADSFELLKLMQDWTGHEPKMWGDSIIGYGQYHYKSERSPQEGDWMLVGFSPRKSAISLYVYSGQEDLLKELGKFKMGKSCIYVKKLTDIHQETLKKMVKTTMAYLQAKHS